MKNLRCIVMACLIFYPLSLAAQTKSHGILANVGTLIIGNYELFYEQCLNKQFSISTSVTYYDTRRVVLRLFSYGYLIGLGFAPKLHIFGQAHKNSFYVAPSAKAGYVVHPAMSESQTTHRDILVRMGANFGYQHVFSFGCMIDIMAGIEHYYNFSLTKNKTRFQDNDGKIVVRPVFAASIGYAF